MKRAGQAEEAAMRLAGKAVIVTAQGIGRGMAERFLAEGCRVGRVEEVAALVDYLASEQSGFVTGQNFVVDGGMTRKMIYV